MALLGRISISAKVLSLVTLLNLLALTLAGLGYYALGRMVEETRDAAEASSRALDAVVANRAMTAMSRSEYLIAALPTRDVIQGNAAQIAEERKAVEQRLANMRQAARQDVKAALAKAETAVTAYLSFNDATLRLAQTIADRATPEQQAQLATASLASRGAFQEARTALRDLTGVQVNRSNDTFAAAFSNAATLQTMMLTIGVGALVFGSLLGLIIGRSGISNPIRTLTACLATLAQGRFDVSIAGTTRRDEVGDIARAAETFKANGIEAAELRAEQEAAKARAEKEQQEMMRQMADDFDRAVGGIVAHVSSAATQLTAAARTMSSAAEEASVQSGAVAAASEEASANVQTVASATEELSASVREIGERVEQSARMASAAVADADSSAGMIKDLAEKAQKIGEIVELINSIASQTNLLALNATIEAARAGEAGKGFAVVAAEVKSLADQTSKATTDIASQITGIQAATSQSAEAITGIAGAIREISAVASSISAAVEQQNAATQEIARNVQEASAGTGEVSTNIAGVSHAVSETGAAATQVLGSAETLSAQANALNTEMGKFLATIRAA
jgi:methyl-accepting chemotaxis protein